MQTEKSRNPAPAEEHDPSVEEQQDSSLSWLLDQELAETGDSLFTVALDDDGDLELTEAEAMMASRPLVRGSNDNEILSAFVEEEIVVGSVGDSSDIYTGSARKAEPAKARPVGEQMIVEHGGKHKSPVNGVAGRNVAGDILGLRDDDDMGERYLVIRKTPAAPAAPVSLAPATTAPQPAPAPTATGAETATATTQPLVALTDSSEAIATAPPAIESENLEEAPISELSEPLELAQSLPAEPEDAFPAEHELAPEIDALIVDDEEHAGDDVAAIDYHLDFEPSREDAAAIVTAVTPLLAQVVEALQIQVDQRAGELALVDAQQLQLDCTLATDAATDEQSVNDGFIALTAFTDNLPACVSDLDDNAIGAIRVRLTQDGTTGDWNALLQQGFEAPSASSAASMLPPIEFQSVVSANDEVNALADYDDIEDLPPLDSGFSEAEILLLDDLEGAPDLLAQEDAAEAVAGALPGTPCAGDSAAGTIVDLAAADHGGETTADSPFGNLDEDEDWSLAAMASGSLVDTDSELLGFDEFIDGATAIDAGSCGGIGDAGPQAASSAQPPLGEAPEDVFPAAAVEQIDETGSVPATLDSSASVAVEEPPEVPDIFGDDLDDDLGFEVAANDTDVDALLDSLDIGVEPGDVDLVGAIAMAESAQADAPASIENPAAHSGSSRDGDDQPDAVPAVAASAGEAPAAFDAAGPWCIPDTIEFSYTSASGAELFADFLDAFLEEGAVEVEKLEDAISLWEQDIDSEDAYAPVPRILHTLKGIAKGVGLQRYGTLIHNFETLLDKLERPGRDQSAGYFRIVNAWLDAAVRGFEKIEDQRADVESEFPQVDAPLPPAGVEADTSGAPTDTAKAAARTDDKTVADEGAKALAAQQTIRLSVDAVDHLMNLTNQAQQLGVRSSQGSVRGKMALAELQGRLSSVRSHIARIADRALMNVTARGGAPSAELDALEMDQYSELQEAASILREGVEDLSELIQMTSRQNALVEALLKQQNSVMSSLRSAIQAARVIPVSRLMPGLRRIVRTVGADLGKDVTFRVLNETGKLDRDNFNRCQVVLEHMVRNALDHGIEDPATRRAAGKSATGRITVDVGKDRGDYLIRLSDDGRGMDPAVIREAAYRKGLDVDLENLGDDEVLRLIFHKGFSTAASVSEVSGRGVGMDIVLSELQAIGGSIDIDSRVGEGSTFTLRIPSNVTAHGALLVSAGEHSYAIPLDGLVAVEHVPVAAFFGAIDSNEPLELFSLQCEPAYLATLCHGEKMPDRNTWSATLPVIVAGNGEHYMAIAIDDVEQALELVIRSLGSQFGKVPGLAGGATTADGRAIVALNLNELVGSLAARGADRVAMAEEQQDDMLVMVVDDSRTQRLVATSKFDSLGVETITAENGMAAIDLLNASHRLPDVILLDVEMPVKDGIQTLKELRKSTRYRDIPVIMVTSRTGAKHRKMAAEAGCNGYMGKPFNFPLLVQDINKLTGRQLSLG